jgi:SAM-dependent methyltransferase
MDLVEAAAGQFRSGQRHPWEGARLTVAADLIDRHVPFSPGDVVLDVGCGDIFVAEALAGRHPAVQFIAVDSAFTDALMQALAGRARSNVTLAASLDRVTLGVPPALILLMDVIEHVPDDRAFLREILDQAGLGPATRVLITVPSYPALTSDHDVFLGHYRRYTRASLRALVEATGLSIVEDGYFFTSLAAARGLQVVKSRIAPSSVEQTGVGRWRGGAMLTRIVVAALTLDARLGIALHRLGLRVPGLSTFAVCRRLP